MAIRFEETCVMNTAPIFLKLKRPRIVYLDGYTNGFCVAIVLGYYIGEVIIINDVDASAISDRLNSYNQTSIGRSTNPSEHDSHDTSDLLKDQYFDNG